MPYNIFLPEIAERFYANCAEINNSDDDTKIKIRNLSKLFNEILNTILIAENRTFSGLQTKLLYCNDKFSIDSELFIKLNQSSLFIAKAKRNKNFKVYDRQCSYIIKSLVNLISLFSGTEIPTVFNEITAVDYLFKLSEKIELKTDEPIKVIVKSISSSLNAIEMLCTVIESDEEIKININKTNNYESEYFEYLKNLPLYTKIYFYKLQKSLFNESFYNTNLTDYFVVEPDFLLDVSDIASCFLYGGANYKIYFLDKMFNGGSSKATIRGNIVNNMLDLRIIENNNDFEYLFEKAAEKSLMPISLLSERDFEEIKNEIKYEHFPQIEKISHYLLKVKTEQNADISIEPTFYSELHGLQGRLDVMVEFNDEPERKEIIELKSGVPCSNGVWANEQMQALGYDLMLQSVFGNNRRGTNNIMYSRAKSATFRNVKRGYSEEIIFCKIRNLIICEILKQANGNFDLYEQFNPVDFGNLPKYLTEKLNKFYSVYKLSDSLSLKYFKNYLSFVWNEIIAVKLGNRIYTDFEEQGFSSLWLSNIEDKKEKHRIIDELNFESYDLSEKLYKFSYTGCITNFRKNDIAIIYKNKGGDTNPLKQQIYKCTIKDISSNNVVISLRSEQPRVEIFTSDDLYCIEHDLFDKNYFGLISSLFNFLAKEKEKRELLLGVKTPLQNELLYDEPDYNSYYIKKALSANNYFLLQGPPGTGKTSTFLINYIKALYYNTNLQVMIVTFTNRSLDEVIKHLVNHNLPFVLVSSSSNEEYSFKTILKSKKFKEHPFSGFRICLATISSYLLYENEIKYHFKVNTLIIDEASQIAEVQLAGILIDFEKFVMIGDHNQLPAISVQADEFCSIDDENLNEIGLVNLKDSFFERLYNLCQKKNLVNNIDLLTKHYRMHKDIADLINPYYNNKLICGDVKQSQQDKLFENIEIYGQKPFNKRVIFIDVDSYSNNFNKTCIEEAEVTKVLLENLSNKIENIEEDTFGIITPFRAQISVIRNEIRHLPFYDKLQIDTIERYQGSEKQIIIISFGVSYKTQLKSITSFNNSGTLDRKLNVAISRAKDYLVLVGNQKILELHPHLKELINEIKLKNSYIKLNDFGI